MKIYAMATATGDIEKVELLHPAGKEPQIWLHGLHLSLRLTIADAEQLHDQIGGALRQHSANRMVVKAQP